MEDPRKIASRAALHHHQRGARLCPPCQWHASRSIRVPFQQCSAGSCSKCPQRRTRPKVPCHQGTAVVAPPRRLGRSPHPETLAVPAPKPHCDGPSLRNEATAEPPPAAIRRSLSLILASLSPLLCLRCRRVYLLLLFSIHSLCVSLFVVLDSQTRKTVQTSTTRSCKPKRASAATEFENQHARTHEREKKECASRPNAQP